MTFPVIKDRQALGLSISKYRDMAEGLANNCYLNKTGDSVKISKAKSKKLKNMRQNILKDPVKSQSLIYMELVRRLNIQISKKERRPIL